MSLSDFQKLLAKVTETGAGAVATNREEKSAALKVDLKKKLKNTYSSLPSDIDFSASSKSKASGKAAEAPSNGGAPEQKTKAKSYKNLLKMAKTITPAGLVVKEASTTAKQKQTSLSEPRRAATSSTKLVNKGQRITSLNPHHPDYRPPTSSNSSMSFLKQPKPRAFISSPKAKARNANPSKHIPKDLIMLNTKKRDLASVEEIHDEMMRKKKKALDGTSSSISREPQTRYSQEQRGSRNPPAPLGSAVRVHQLHASKSNFAASSRASSVPPAKNISSSKKQTPSGSTPREFRPKPPANDYSSAIQEIFGYNRHKYRDEDSDDSSDMEVNYRDLEREEKKSLRLGKKEDLEEEMRELAKLNKNRVHSRR